MRQSVAVVLAVFALAGAGCGGATTPAPEQSDARVTVPDLRGVTLRDATCRLKDMGLRWRLRGERRAYTRQFSGCGDGDEGIANSGDDDPVTGQTPAPGTRVRRGAVVTLDTECADLARSGANARCA
jgi:beta-lactam-binding protein with PASTA domain